VGRDDSAINACTATATSMTRFGLWFLPIIRGFKRRRMRTSWRVKGLEDHIFSVRLFLTGSFERYVHQSPVSFFFPCRNPPRRSVFTAVFSVCPPCTSSHSCRVCRLAVRYPVALQLRNGQRNVFSLPFSFSSTGFNPNPRHPFYTYYVFPPRVSAQFLRTNDTILPAYT